MTTIPIIDFGRSIEASAAELRATLETIGFFVMVNHGVPPSQHYADAACSAKFNFVFREGNHMHLDLDPEHVICTVSIL